MHDNKHLNTETECRRLEEKLREANARLANVFETISDGVVIFDAHMNYTYVNARGGEILGRKPEDLIGKNYWQEYPEAKGSLFANAYERAMKTQTPAIFEGYYPPFGRWFENRVYPTKNGLTIFFNDITERKKMETALRESEERYRKTFETILDAIVITRLRDGKYIDVNQGFERLSGLSREEAIGKTSIELNIWRNPDDRQRVYEKIKQNGICRQLEADFNNKNGHFFTGQMSASLINIDGEDCIISVTRDITEQKKAERALHESKRRLAKAEQVAHIGNWSYEVATGAISWSDELWRIFGREPGAVELDYDTLLSWIRPDFRGLHDDYMARMLKLKPGESLEDLSYCLVRPNGEERWVDVKLETTFDDNGQPLSFFGTVQDITEQKQAVERINYLANFDSLTGLPNRAQLTDHIRYALNLAKRRNEKCAVMFVDIDLFKNINDTFGHSVGDALIVTIARRLQSVLRAEDTVGRLGGDEFILMLPKCDMQGAAQVAQKILHTVSEPCQIEQFDLAVTASIGIAMYPDNGVDIDSLFKSADNAMYRAKQAGRNAYRFFTPEMHARAARSMQLLNALRQALAQDQFQLYYQPQVAIEDGRVLGAEALLRWTHPQLGPISPAEFVPIAEENGLILPLGEWTLRTAVKKVKQWMDEGHPPMMIAVNLSAVQFRDKSFPQRVSSILEETGLPPQHLELELTERVAASNPLHAIEVMDDLHERGVCMSIDDFGTGYSSLSYLKKFKIYKLKIDQSFVRDIHTDPGDRAIVTAIIGMAKSLGLKSIAEGVETAEQLAFLREHGCDEIQGYYFSKPLPADEFAAFITRNAT